MVLSPSPGWRWGTNIHTCQLQPGVAPAARSYMEIVSVLAFSSAGCKTSWWKAVLFSPCTQVSNEAVLKDRNLHLLSESSSREVSEQEVIGAGVASLCPELFILLYWEQGLQSCSPEEWEIGIQEGFQPKDGYWMSKLNLVVRGCIVRHYTSSIPAVSGWGGLVMLHYINIKVFCEAEWLCLRLSTGTEEKVAVNVVCSLVWLNRFVWTGRLQIFQMVFCSF